MIQITAVLALLFSCARGLELYCEELSGSDHKIFYTVEEGSCENFTVGNCQDTAAINTTASSKAGSFIYGSSQGSTEEVLAEGADCFVKELPDSTTAVGIDCTDSNGGVKVVHGSSAEPACVSRGANPQFTVGFSATGSGSAGYSGIVGSFRVTCFGIGEYAFVLAMRENACMPLSPPPPTPTPTRSPTLPPTEGPLTLTAVSSAFMRGASMFVCVALFGTFTAP